MERSTKISVDAILAQNESIKAQGIFILDHGWHQMITECSQKGMSVVMPNFLMTPKLILQTVVGLNRSIVVTSKEIWKQIKEAFEGCVECMARISVILF